MLISYKDFYQWWAYGSEEGSHSINNAVHVIQLVEDNRICCGENLINESTAITMSHGNQVWISILKSSIFVTYGIQIVNQRQENQDASIQYSWLISW